MNQRRTAAIYAVLYAVFIVHRGCLCVDPPAAPVAPSTKPTDLKASARTLVPEEESPTALPSPLEVTVKDDNSDIGASPPQAFADDQTTVAPTEKPPAIDEEQSNTPAPKGSDDGNGFFDFRKVYTTTTTTPKPTKTAEEPDYIFLGPNMIRATTDSYEGIFQLLGAKNRDKTVAASKPSSKSTDNNDKVELTLRKLNNDKQWVTLVSSGEQPISVAAVTTLNLSISDEVRAELRTITKSIRNQYDDNESDKLRLYLSGEFNSKPFLRYTRVNYDSRNTTVFIQTDKGIYKPGETVKFRIIAVDVNSLRPANDAFDVQIEDPSGNLIRKWSRVRGERMPGYFASSVNISSEPTLGEWKIVATQNGVEKVAKFTIDKYVLPKFEVKLNMPEEVSTDDEKIIVNVKAKYTYGKPVKGELYVKSDCQNVERVYSCFDGSANVTLRNLFAGKKSEYWYTPSCRVDVSLEEALTGKRQNATGTLSAARRQQLEIKISEPFGDFKPGLPYTVDIKLSHTDGRAVARRYAADKLMLTTKINDAKEVRQVDMSELVKKNDTYRATFLTPSYATSLDLTVRFKDQTETTYKYASHSEDSKDMYIQIQPESKSIGENEGGIEAELRWTQPVPKLSYLAIAQGRIIDSGEYAVGDVQPNEFGYYSKNITAQALPPKTKLLIFAPQYSGGNTIVDSMSFDVAGVLRNNVSLTVAPETERTVGDGEQQYARPGENAIIRVETEPQSLVGVLAVDKSVKLLKDLNDITRADVLKTIMDIDDDSGPYRSRYSYVFDDVSAFARSSEALASSLPTTSTFESESGCDDFFGSNLLVISSICRRRGEPRPVAQYHHHNFRGFNGFGGGVGAVAFSSKRRTTSTRLRSQPAEYSNVAYDAVGGSSSIAALAESAPLVPYQYIAYDSAPGRFQPQMLFAAAPDSFLFSTTQTIAAAASSVQFAKVSAEGAAGSPADAPAPPRVRQEFPETWLWFDDIANTSTSEYRRQVPDTITTWLVKAVALHPQRGLGVSNDFAELRVFQPFFVQMQLPYSVVRNELLYLQVSVFNYQDAPVDVQVKLEFEDAKIFEFEKFNTTNSTTDDAESSATTTDSIKKITVKAQDGATVTFPIRPRRLGEQLLIATAQVIGGAALGDTEKRRLKIVAEGKPVYYNVPLFIDLRNKSGNAVVEQSVPILLPRESENYVADSEHVQVSVTGDMMAPTIRGLSNLVRLPTGCGEQNMLNFVPNILVLRYLKQVERLTPEIREQALDFLRQGYQRELKYRHTDGSYSAFGEHDGRGSTWLTAFVLKSYAQAKPYLDTDRNATRQSLQWLLSQQERDGMFGEKGHILSTRMQGGAGSTTTTSQLNIPLTAYTLIALAYNNVSHNAVERSANYLASQRAQYSSSDAYSLAIATYAMKLTDSSSRVAQQMLGDLERLHAQTDDQGRVYWTQNKNASKNSAAEKRAADAGYYYSPPPADVEMTAYVLLTYVLDKNLEKALPVARWLIAQRNDQGGFTSTQDTVIALEALERFASLVFEANQNVEISVTAQGGSQLQKEKFTVNDENAVLLQIADLNAGASLQEIRVTAKGSGTAIVDIAYHYNVKDDKGVPAFRLRVDTKEPSALSAQLDVCVDYLKPHLPSMVLVEAELPSGYEADPEETAQLVQRYKGTLSRVDTEQRNTRVVLYFDQMKRANNCVRFGAYRKFAIDDLKPKTVTVYDYYDPRDRQVATYSLGQTENICDNWIDDTLPCPKK